MNKNNITELNQKYPFLSYGKYYDEDVVGIVQNKDNNLIAMYVLNKITDTEVIKSFIKHGEVWWWESNREIPIDIFLGDSFSQFSPFLVTMSLKDYEHITGPIICLDNLNEKRVKRRSIQLIRKSQT